MNRKYYLNPRKRAVRADYESCITELHLYNVRQGIEGAKENTWAKPLNIILAISIKALARALSFSETLHAAFRFSF
ncbi:hypothetical protein G977_04774 [Escherichia coli UMEA 3585-1]|nr:hypothetical protein G977_04774 [Escherichia coli UMEA 3585-1]